MEESKEGHKISLIEKLVERHREEHAGDERQFYPDKTYFKKYDLGTMLTVDFNGSPYMAFEYAGFTDPGSDNYDEKLANTPWLVVKKLRNYWNVKENRIKATRWLVEELDKPITEIRVKDFRDNRIGWLLSYHEKKGEGNGRVFRALTEAGYDILPWEMDFTPRGYFYDKDRRIEAVMWLVAEIGKDPQELTTKDFEKNGLDGLIELMDLFPAVKEAYPHVTEEDMNRVPPMYRDETFERELLKAMKDNGGKIPTYQQLRAKGLHHIEKKIMKHGGMAALRSKYEAPGHLKSQKSKS